MLICCVIVLLFYIKCIIYKYIYCNLYSTQNKLLEINCLLSLQIVTEHIISTNSFIYFKENVLIKKIYFMIIKWQP